MHAIDDIRQLRLEGDRRVPETSRQRLHVIRHGVVFGVGVRVGGGRVAGVAHELGVEAQDEVVVLEEGDGDVVFGAAREGGSLRDCCDGVED